ncbi:MAG: hypothetical protein AAGI06_08165 [Pseudomonadota bacterium]
MFNQWKKQISFVEPYSSGSQNPFDYDPYADMPGVEISGPWHSKMAAHLKQKGIRRVKLNALKGSLAPDFEFLSELDHLKALTLQLRDKNTGPVPLEALNDLQQFRCTHVPFSAPLNFASLSNLRSCALAWGLHMRSVLSCERLERLYLTGLKATESQGLAALSSLKSLQLAHTSLASLAPIAGLTGMERLDLMVARKLESLEPLGELTKLRCLYLAEAHKISSLEHLRPLKNLEALIMVDCGEIESLRPLAELKKLKAVCFAGAKTTIRDGDLSPLTGLEELAMLMFGSRRHYSHKLIKKWNWANYDQPDTLLKAA